MQKSSIKQNTLDPVWTPPEMFSFVIPSDWDLTKVRRPKQTLRAFRPSNPQPFNPSSYSSPLDSLSGLARLRTDGL